MQPHKLEKSFHLRDTLAVARDLIGCFLVRYTQQGVIVGRINEAEAYLGVDDKASHSYGGRRTPRTRPLYAEGGIAYVHMLYGIHYNINVVTREEDVPCGVLLRGADILEGIGLAANNRYGLPFDALDKARKKNLCNGPGKLCKAFAIGKELNWEDLSGERLFLCDAIGHHHKQVGAVATGPRIGIGYAEEAKDFPWRFTG